MANKYKNMSMSKRVPIFFMKKDEKINNIKFYIVTDIKVGKSSGYLMRKRRKVL